MDSLSDYAKQLKKESKARYIEKLSLIGGVDPYNIPAQDFILVLDLLPRVTYSKMLEFLIFRLDPQSQAEVKSFKSLDAFAQFSSKWIESIRAIKINELFIVFGRVLHSQKVSQPPTRSWFIISAESDVVACHCDCVAGLGEACTHVAAVLFAFEYAGKHAGEKSVTDVLGYWIGPKSKAAFYQKIRDTDFSTPSTPVAEASSNKQTIPALSNKEVQDFLNNYEEQGCISVLQKFFSPGQGQLPKPLTDIYRDVYCNLALEELQVVALTVDEKNISLEQALDIEKRTKNQSKCSDWFLMRAGRITASKFKSACRTRVEKPSISLINNICYPHMYRATFKAGRYGCAHEKDAINSFLHDHQKTHQAKIEKCGLFINPAFPQFAATPDGILICVDCEDACVEVKCPLCAADTSVEELIKIKKTCLISDAGNVMLDKDHAYYYQIQMQMAVTGKKTCFFVVWSPQDFFVEKIAFDEHFWTTQSAIATHFHESVIIPELLGKYFSKRGKAKAAKDFDLSEASGSREVTGTTADAEEEPPELWCYCNGPDDGDELVRCTQRNCPIKFFHKACVLKETKKISKKWKCKHCSQ